MKESPNERHNRLATEFVQMAGREVKDFEELMILVESTMVASLGLLTKQHRMPPAQASAMMEMALQEATVRFAEMRK